MSKLRREIPMHLMLLPSVIVVLIFSYGPMFGIIMAFQNYSPALGFSKSPWVGLDNFLFIARLPGSFQILWNTLYMSFFKIVGSIIVPVTFSILLNEVSRSFLRRSAQTIIYLPHFMSWVILSGIFIDILSPSTGIVNEFLGLFGVEPIFFLGDKAWFPNVMIATDIWKSFGYGTIIYMAALTGIDPGLYESSAIDGANRIHQVFHITLPSILPVIILMTVLNLGNVLNAGFDQVFNMYNVSVYETGDIIDTFVFRLGMKQAQYSPAAAVGLFKSAVSFFFITVSYILADKLANYRVI